MRKRSVTVVALGFAGLLLGGPLGATQREVRDDQGRVIFVVEDDGTAVSYSYDEQGNRIATQRSDGSRTEANPSSSPPEPPAGSHPGDPN